MGPGLLRCVALCLLGAGHVWAMIIQNPRYQITRAGKPVTLSCSQNMNHDVMYWYQQKLNQAPKLLFYYYDTQFNNETDTSDNFQPSRPNLSAPWMSAHRAWGTRPCTCVPAAETQ
uniref:T cell receptor beta variable 15 n=1 Tax=Otolemur garnettii TaxID=30611 RepID=H0XH99_OTOGA